MSVSSEFLRKIKILDTVRALRLNATSKKKQLVRFGQ